MEESDFEKLLDAKLEPIKENMGRLEKVYERMVDALSSIARQEEKCDRLREDFEKGERVHNIIFDRIQAIEKESHTKVWSILMLLIGSLISGILGIFIGKRF